MIAANTAKRGNIDFINTVQFKFSVFIRCWIDLVLLGVGLIFSWAAMRVPSVAFLRSPFLNQFQLLGSLNSVALKYTL